MRCILLFLLSLLLAFSSAGCSSEAGEMKELMQYRNGIEDLIKQYEKPPVVGMQTIVYRDHFYNIAKKANSLKIQAKTAALSMKTEKAQKAGMTIVNVADSLEKLCNIKNEGFILNQEWDGALAHLTSDQKLKEFLRINWQETAEQKVLKESKLPEMHAAFKGYN